MSTQTDLLGHFIAHAIEQLLAWRFLDLPRGIRTPTLAVVERYYLLVIFDCQESHEVINDVVHADVVILHEILMV